MNSWRDLPGPARAVGAAVTKAVSAAEAGSTGSIGAADALAEYEPATAELVDPAAGLVLASVTRRLLESQHPDGLDSDDIAKVLGQCYQSSAAWLPDVDVSVLLAVLASALGIHEPGLTYDEIGPPPAGPDGDVWRDPTDEVPHHAPTPAEYARHAPLIVAGLLAAGQSRLNPVLDAAFAEIAETEAMEMP